MRERAVIEQMRAGDLYATLALATRDELDPLVKILLKKLSNFLVINEDYKKYQPDHTKYHKLIGDEIRLYGGNSMKNILRGGEGPSYADIVVDVCKKLGVPCERENTTQNEANLLDIFVKQRWNALTAEEREKLATEARQSALGQASDAAAAGKAGFSILVAGMIAGPLGWAMLGKTLLDPAFKVTIPCVLHIAHLRREKLRALDMLDIGTDTGASTGFAAASMETAQTVGAAELVITDADRDPVLSLSLISAPPNGAWHEVDRSDEGINRLSQLLQSVPALAAAGEVATTNYMKVVIPNGQRLVQTKAGELIGTLIKNNDSQFSGQARLFEPDRLAGLVNVSALMNLASTLLAQKHLADISKRLSELKAGVETIREFQKDERRSVLTGAVRYFEQVAPSVLEGERPDRVLQQIERHEAELLRIQDHLNEDIRTETERLNHLDDDEWFGTSKMNREIHDHQELIRELYRELLLCIRARACGWQLLCVFPGEEKGKEARRRDIQQSLDALKIDQDLLARTDRLLQAKIHKLSSFWNKRSTLNERKLTLLRASEGILNDIEACRIEVLQDLHAAGEMLSATKRPMALALRLEDGRIAAAQSISMLMPPATGGIAAGRAYLDELHVPVSSRNEESL